MLCVCSGLNIKVFTRRSIWGGAINTASDAAEREPSDETMKTTCSCANEEVWRDTTEYAYLKATIRFLLTFFRLAWRINLAPQNLHIWPVLLAFKINKNKMVNTIKTDKIKSVYSNHCAQCGNIACGKQLVGKPMLTQCVIQKKNEHVFCHT